MEEIDIIELLKRVKEGKAPKKIEIDGVVYERNTDEQFFGCIDLMYCRNTAIDEPTDWWIDDKDVTLYTRIKILDKPIIERLGILPKISNENEIMLKDKINEIINWINNKENKDE